MAGAIGLPPDMFTPPSITPGSPGGGGERRASQHAAAPASAFPSPPSAAAAPPPLPARPPLMVNGQPVPAPSAVLPLFRDEWVAAATAVEFAAAELACTERDAEAASMRLAALMGAVDAAHAAVQNAPGGEADMATLQAFFDAEQRKEEMGPALAQEMDTLERRVADMAGGKAAAEARVEENRSAMAAKLPGLMDYVSRMEPGPAKDREAEALRELRQMVAPPPPPRPLRQ